MTRQAWRDLATGASFANLLLLRAWAALLNPANHYLLGQPPSRTSLAVTIGGVVVLAAILFGTARTVRRYASAGAARVSAGLAFLGACLVVLNALRQQLPVLTFDRLRAAGGAPGLLLGVGVVVGLAGIALRRWRIEGIARAAAGLVLAALPFAAVTVGRALFLGAQPASVQASFRDQAPAAPQPGNLSSPRVVFLVLDGLDQTLLEEERPRDLALPAFDALFSRSVRWDDAYPPSQSTLVSMPSLITGRAVRGVRATAANELVLDYFGGQKAEPWSAASGLFSRVQDLGGDAALIGWYHPYCRVLGRQLQSCRSYPYSPEPENPFVESLQALGTSMLDTVPGAFRLRGGSRGAWSWPSGQTNPGWHQHLYTAIHAETLRAVGDPDLELVFAHYPIPHEPAIFDRHSGTLTRSGATYVDNLALADRALGELREALAVAGLGTRTALLVTADHAHRRAGDERLLFPVLGRPEHRVPLILHLPGQTKSQVRHETTRNIIAHTLAIAVLARALRTPVDVDAVLAQAAARSTRPQW